MYSTLIDSGFISSQQKGPIFSGQFTPWVVVPDMYLLFTNGIYGSAARTEGKLTRASSLRSSLGNFVIPAQTNTSIMSTVVLDGTLRIEGQLAMVNASSLSFVNGSLYIVGALDFSSDCGGIALPNGVLLVGPDSQLMVRITSTPILVANATTVITIPVASYSIISDSLSTFRSISIYGDFQGSECFLFESPQQVSSPTTLSVTLTVSQSTASGCASPLIVPSGSSSERLSTGAIVGITLGCVAIGALVVVAIVLVTRYSTALRNAKIKAQLRQKEIEISAIDGRN
jgi:hypothetical protein